MCVFVCLAVEWSVCARASVFNVWFTNTIITIVSFCTNGIYDLAFYLFVAVQLKLFRSHSGRRFPSATFMLLLLRLSSANTISSAAATHKFFCFVFICVNIRVVFILSIRCVRCVMACVCVCWMCQQFLVVSKRVTSEKCVLHTTDPEHKTK